MRASKVRALMIGTTPEARRTATVDEWQEANAELEALEELAGAVVKAYEAQVDPIGFATLEPLFAIVTKAELEEVPA